MDLLARFARYNGKPPEEAKFYWSGGPVEVAERTYFGSAFSGVTAFETDAGIVLVDSGLKKLGPMLASMIRAKTKAPIHTAIFTQGHVDHAFGLQAFLAEGQAEPRVIAHRAMPARFARYRRTAGHNEAINARQFGGTVRAREGESGADFETFDAPAIPPTILYDRRLDLEVGGVRFEVHHCRGETDDHSWVWCPDRGVLCPGDLFIWAMPNAGNPQKVQRYAGDWALGLRTMAALEPRSLCPGHGGPVVDDAALVKRMLLSTAEVLEDLVEQTVAAMNAGSPPHVDIVHQVRLPEREEPWLQNVYDDAEFIVRNVVRHLGGWWTGRPSELKPPPREALAKEIAGLSGGAAKLAERATALSAKGDHRLAGSLADYALEAAPDDEAVRQAVAEVYRARSEREPGLMAQNLFASAAAYAEEGRPYR
jgi:glyoxylase-like metal-dependent hydrolase (beta-lactamase superfamily II)